jgi:NADH dehydrogenase [ubiquinone] 1 alpha subcomplex assembly factor 7
MDRAARAQAGVITLKDRLVALIAQNGPMTVAQFLTSALHDPMSGYYARRAQLGADGDFITAPEISQMFGELVGLWCAQAWLDMGAPPRLELIELGPGTGRLMSDIWRAAKAAPGFRDAIEITLVETSAPLREQQRAMLGDAPVSWMTRFEDASEGPAIVVANEFLDCMPIRQFVRVKDGWR